MPALKYTHHFQSRSDNSGRNFSIIFAVIAFVIVAGCLFWGIFLPKYRKKHPRHPSSTRYNTPHHPQAFLSHPALLRGFRKRPSSQLRQYNPRTQTPFPNTPPPGNCISLPSLAPRNRSAHDLGAPQKSAGLFSPARDRLSSRRGLPTNVTAHDTSLGEGLQLPRSASDYILPVPGPIALRAKSAGRAPTLAKQLDQFPVPRSGSAETGKLAHPKKLFEDLEQRYSKTTTITSLETPSPMPLNTQRQNELARKCVLDTKSTDKLESRVCPPDCRPTLGSETYIMDRSETQCSSTSESDTRVRMIRAGTVTRPKTPVVEIRERCDCKAIAAKTNRGTSSKPGTISSTEYPTDSTFSSYVRSDTPPTSSGPCSKSSEPAATVLGKDGTQNPDNMTPTPNKTYDRHNLSSLALPVSGRSAPMSTIPEGQKDEFRISGALKANRSVMRPRPAQLNLAAGARSPSVRKRLQSHSVSSLGSLLMPLVKSKRPSIQASSIYSRDTRGVSVARSPISPGFSENASADAEKEEGSASPRPRKASSLELLRCKIDNWDLHTADLAFPTSPSSALKRALSDLGPRSPTFPNPRRASLGTTGEDPQVEVEQTVPKICIGRPSDDIFRDPSPNVETGMVFKQVLHMGVATSMSCLARSPSEASAPGGADWI